MLLHHLESESIHILREVAAECRAPVFLYSIGKDSSVLLRLMQKAFHPAPIPFPLLHIDTGWKFQAMIAHRDRTARELGLRLLVHTNRAAQQAGINPFDHPQLHLRHEDRGPARGARRRRVRRRHRRGAPGRGTPPRQKERVFSLRAPGHAWDPKRQRPEF